MRQKTCVPWMQNAIVALLARTNSESVKLRNGQRLVNSQKTDFSIPAPGNPPPKQVPPEPVFRTGREFRQGGFRPPCGLLPGSNAGQSRGDVPDINGEFDLPGPNTPVEHRFPDCFSREKFRKIAEGKARAKNGKRSWSAIRSPSKPDPDGRFSSCSTIFLFSLRGL